MNNERKAVIVDIDGTLCRMTGRSPYDYDRVHEDTPHEAVVELVQILADRYFILLVSGREDTCREQTNAWLGAHEVPSQALWMRPAGDYRDDREVKAEIYHREIEGSYDVAFVLDDRDKVVKMWRELGLVCLQVADGEF